MKNILWMRRGITEIAYEMWSWFVRLRQRRAVESCEHVNEPSGSIKRDIFFTTWETISFSEITAPCKSIIMRGIKSRMRWEGQVARKGHRRGACRVLVGRSEGKRPLGRPKRIWKDNIKIYLQELGWVGMYWSGSEYGQVRGACECHNERSGSTKCGEFLD
jgi:hypothetical protein